MRVRLVSSIVDLVLFCFFFSYDLLVFLVSFFFYS